MLKKKEVTINKKCTIEKYEEHNYAKNYYIYKKIEKNDIIEYDMKKASFQEQYFKYIYLNFRTLTYNDILVLIFEKYNVKEIYYTLTKFNNFKSNINKVLKKKHINYDYLNKIELNGIKLLLANFQFIDTEENIHHIKLFGTINSMSFLNDKNITQYFIDSTYKCLPNNMPKCKTFLLIIGYDCSIDSFQLCCAATLSHKDYDTLCELYSYLKNIWNFNPKKITYVFALGNINAINKIIKNVNIKILPCFFHLKQCWWIASILP